MKKKLLILSLALAGAPAFGADLLQVYRDAIDYDAQFASAKAAWEAGQEKLPQGRAGLLPAPVIPVVVDIRRGELKVTPIDIVKEQ